MRSPHRARFVGTRFIASLAFMPLLYQTRRWHLCRCYAKRVVGIYAAVMPNASLAFMPLFRQTRRYDHIGTVVRSLPPLAAQLATPPADFNG